MASQQELMKKLFYIEDTSENRISYYLLAFFVVSLPFDRFYSELTLILFLVHTIIHLTKTKLHHALSIETLILTSVFLVTVIGLSYSPYKSEGLKELEKQLSILLFPILLSTCGLNLRRYGTNFLLLFAFSCVLNTLYLYFDAIRIIRYNNMPISTLFSGAFINHNFSSPVGIHATYFAMYCLLSAVVVIYVFLRRHDKTSRIIYVFSLLVLLAGLLQLASKAVLISGVIISLCLPFLLFKSIKTRMEWIAVIGGALAVGGILIANSASFKMRYVAEFKGDLSQQSINNEILEPRLTRWDYILHVVKRSPLTGYGTGSEMDLLKRTYFENKLYNSYLHELNSHNQYLSFLVETGAWGLCVFLLTLIAGLAGAIRQKNVYLLSFLIIVCIVSFSENILDTNKGIFFYSFFFSLFVLAGKPFANPFRFKRSRDYSGSLKSSNASPVRSHNNL